MARRTFADISTGALTGAGTGGTIGATAGGPWGAAIGAGVGGILGGVGSYFAGKADQPYDAMELESMGIQNKMGMAQLDQYEEAEKERKRRARMKKAFAAKIGRAYRGATRTMGAI